MGLLGRCRAGEKEYDHAFECRLNGHIERTIGQIPWNLFK